MKQCDDHLAIASSSLPFTASAESDPEDSFWRDFFDFSFLTSDDHKSGLDDVDTDSNDLPKGESELYGGLGIVNSNVTERSPPLPSVLGVTNDSVAKGKEACLERNESSFSPLFAKMSALQIKECSNDDTEVDSPCWKGANIAESGSSSVNLRRSRDDVNVLYGLNPMAPQFIPSNSKMKLDNKNGKEFEGNGLKRSLSSTFPPSSSGEFSTSNLYEDGIEQGSDQTNSIGVMIHEGDQSLGLVCQDSVSEAMGILDINQRRTKLDPLAPVFVPAYTDRNAHSTYASSGVGSNPYSDQSGKIHSSNNPRLGSPVQKKKLNPLAPQFSLPDTKPKVYQAPNDLPTDVNSPLLFSPGFTHPSVHVDMEVDTKQMGRHPSYIAHGNSSPQQMDVKKLLTTIHGLSELLTHVHGSGSPNQQHLHLINSTVHNLNSYVNNRVQEEHTGNFDGLTSLPPNIFKQSIREHQIPKARNLSSTVDFRRKDKYPMVKGAEPQVEYLVTKENGFGQAVRNHETEELINPQGLFYKSLWLKARADRSLMEYEKFLSSSTT